MKRDFYFSQVGMTWEEKIQEWIAWIKTEMERDFPTRNERR